MGESSDCVPSGAVGARALAAGAAAAGITGARGARVATVIVVRARGDRGANGAFLPEKSRWSTRCAIGAGGKPGAASLCAKAMSWGARALRPVSVTTTANADASGTMVRRGAAFRVRSST